MSKIQINDVKLDGGELFNDSETFLDELQDTEMEQIVGGLSRVSPDEYVRSVYIREEPFHPIKPIHPIKPSHPIQPIHPIKLIHPRDWKPFPFPNHPQTPVIL